MKICRFKLKDYQSYGIIVNNQIWDFLPEISNENNSNLYATDFIEFFYKNLNLIQEKILNNNMESLLDFDEKILLAPLLWPFKIICLGLNYRDHAQETGMKLPAKPMLFAKATSAIIGPNDDIIIPTIKNNDKYVPIKFIDYEAELAVVVGKKMKKVVVNEVNDYIFGYTILNDVSARVEQRKDKQFFRSKSFDTFAPIGPWIITKD
ncbi:MAG: fumarylacetoacetate hydrolase family protein, partial [Candidatus Helarchaeota archaeon]